MGNRKFRRRAVRLSGTVSEIRARRARSAARENRAAAPGRSRKESNSQASQTALSELPQRKSQLRGASGQLKLVLSIQRIRSATHEIFWACQTYYLLGSHVDEAARAIERARRRCRRNIACPQTALVLDAPRHHPLRGDFDCRHRVDLRR